MREPAWTRTPTSVRRTLARLVALTTAACGPTWPKPDAPIGADGVTWECGESPWTPGSPIRFEGGLEQVELWQRLFTEVCAGGDTGYCTDDDGDPSPGLVRLRVGGPTCAGLPDPSACEAELAEAMSGFTGWILTSNSGGRLQIWRGSDEIHAALGVIDTVEEAMLRVWTSSREQRLCEKSQGRVKGKGFEVAYHDVLSWCPLHYGERVWRVAPDGELTDLGTVENTVDGACVGRKSPGGRPLSTPSRGAPGEWLARHAALEDESVHAFTHLHAELVRHGAPERLRARVLRAASDERRHTRQVATLARRYGATPRDAEVSPTPLRTLEAIAVDNAVEGCVGETWGALIGAWQSTHADDPHVARVMRALAEDEARHAALSWALHRWLSSRLTAPARTRVEAAMAEAAARPAGPFPGVITRPLGLPTAAEGRALREAFRASLRA